MTLSCQTRKSAWRYELTRRKYLDMPVPMQKDQVTCLQGREVVSLAVQQRNLDLILRHWNRVLMPFITSPFAGSCGIDDGILYPTNDGTVKPEQYLLFAQFRIANSGYVDTWLNSLRWVPLIIFFFTWLEETHEKTKEVIVCGEEVRMGCSHSAACDEGSAWLKTEGGCSNVSFSALNF